MAKRGHGISPVVETVTRERRPLLTTGEAATYLNVTERWLKRAVAEQRIPYIRGIGQGRRFDPDALDRMVAEHTVEAA